ncbi:MAG: cytochrome c, partial [Pedobacter sp.]
MKKILLLFIALLVIKGGFSQKLTYYEHIAPIIKNKCTPCHRPGEAAPFALLTYE